MHNPSWPWPTRASASGATPWLAALTMTAIGMMLAAAWPARPPRARKRTKRALRARLPRDARENETSDDDGVRTGQYHAVAASLWTPATLNELPLEAEHLVADAPGSSNHDRRHARRSDDESRASLLDDAV